MKTQRSPLSIAMKSNRRGQPDPFTFVSLNSFNSSWREEEGGCKTNERSEQRSSFCPRNKSMSSKDSQCRQQRLTSSPHFMTKDTWMLAKRGRGAGGGGRGGGAGGGWALAFLMSSRSVKREGDTCLWQQTTSQGGIASLRLLWEKSDKGIDVVTEKKMSLQGGEHWQQVQHGKAGNILVL